MAARDIYCSANFCRGKVYTKANKDNQNGEWVYGTPVQCDTLGKSHEDWIIPMFSIRCNGGWLNISSRYPVDGKTVTRYTGMDDSKHNRIFENDIIRVTYNQSENGYDDFQVMYDKNKYKWIIKCFGEEKVTIYDFEWLATYTDNGSKYVEVIGNIYDMDF